MSSRAEILKAVSQNKPAFTEAPVMPAKSTMSEDDIRLRFIETATLIGAKVMPVNDWSVIKSELNDLSGPGKFIVNTLSELGAMKTSVNEISTTADLEKIERAYIRGQLGVAENGSIWIDESNLPNRLLPFICQHLVIVLPVNNLVSTMHDAYRSIDTFKTGYGAFIAGPSKTADIEQSLVIGAHGARSLVIYLVG